MKRKGFTLIELLVATGIGTLILGASYGSFHAVVRARGSVQARCRLHQDARRALEEITAALRAMRKHGSGSQQFVGEDILEGQLPGDRITFYAVSDRPARRDRGEGDVYEMSFFIVRDEETGAGTLARRKDPGGGDDFLDGGILTEIAPNVVALNFEYYDGLDWSEEWVDPDSSELPKAIRVAVTTADLVTKTVVTLTTTAAPMAPVGSSDAGDGDSDNFGSDSENKGGSKRPS